MRLGRLTNGINEEYEIQSSFVDFLMEKNINTWKDEYHSSIIHRRADFLVYKDNKLINIEAKCQLTRTLFDQLDDWRQVCDYSFALIPDYALTPKWAKARLIDRGYGLIIYSHDSGKITEVLEAHKNKNVDVVFDKTKLKNKIIKDILNKHAKSKIIR